MKGVASNLTALKKPLYWLYHTFLSKRVDRRVLNLFAFAPDDISSALRGMCQAGGVSRVIDSDQAIESDRVIYLINPGTTQFPLKDCTDESVDWSPFLFIRVKLCVKIGDILYFWTLILSDRIIEKLQS
jgi:hypothetical protein